jgi:hypothetical protein
VSFKSYWARAVLEVLREGKKDTSVQDISEATQMLPSDILDTLKSLGLLQYWKGSHYINAAPKVVEEQWAVYSAQKSLEVDPACLHWTPHAPAPPAKPK